MIGWKMLLARALVLIATIHFGYGVKALSCVASDDPCQCSSEWRLSTPTQYSQREFVGQHHHENPSCNVCIFIPQECGFIRQRVIGEWPCGQGGTSQRCDNIPWSIGGSNEQYPICFPAQGLGPCTGIIHIFFNHQLTVKQVARCPEPEACRERIQIDVIPERYTITYIIPDCACPQPEPVKPVVVEIVQP